MDNSRVDGEAADGMLSSILTTRLVVCQLMEGEEMSCLRTVY
jgi:hypothetical protein